MRNVWPLVRVQLRQTWRGSLERMTGTRSRLGLLLIPLLILAFLPLILLFVAMYVGLYWGLEPFGQAPFVLTVALTAGQLLCLIFGVLYVISVFYFSQDLRLLIPLPLRPGEIVLAKLVSILLGEYLSMAPVVIPGLAVYGFLADVGPLYIPFAVLIYLMLPVFPLVLSGLFSLLLMRITALRRNRDLFGSSAPAGHRPGHGPAVRGRFQQGNLQAEDVQPFLENQQPLIQGVSRWIVTSAWGTQALQAGSPALGIPYLRPLTPRVSRPRGADVSVSRSDRHGHPLRSDLLQEPQDQSESCICWAGRRRKPGQRPHLARYLHGPRSRLLR